MRRDLLDETGDVDRWMISYADFITLLFAFFVVMYAISSVNDEKYRVLSDTLAQVFDNEPQSLDPIEIGEPSNAASPHVVDIPDVEGWADPIPGDTTIPEDTESSESDVLAGFTEAGGLSMRVDNDWIEYQISADMLFEPGSAELSGAARSALGELLPRFAEGSYGVTVEGYTDNVPSSSQRFPSNWVLSTARAAAVSGFLETEGLRRERLAAIGYGENHPIATNATPEGRAQNRRVVIVAARRPELSRNLNAGPLRAVVAARNEEPNVPEAVRKEDGGLLFTDGEE